MRYAVSLIAKILLALLVVWLISEPFIQISINSTLSSLFFNLMSLVANFQESFTSLYPATLVDESGFNESEMHVKIYR